MRVILDTNVLVSGIFFSGPPYDILRAWHKGKIKLVISPEILKEYRRVSKELALQFKGVDLDSFLELLSIKSDVVTTAPFSRQICDDKDDDKFLACALASGAMIIVSGDKALLKTSGYQGIQVIKPRDFLEKYLKKKH